MAYHRDHDGQTLFRSNGRLATHHLRAFDVTWYYPDASITGAPYGLVRQVT